MSTTRWWRCYCNFQGEELALVDLQLVQDGLSDPVTRRLMTIPGVDVTVVLSVIAAVDEFGRFASAENGRPSRAALQDPSVGGAPAVHSRITEAGNAHARGILVEAAWVASRTPRPLRFVVVL